MAIKLYGIAGSRAFRSLWMLEELGLPYEHIKTDFKGGGTRTPDYLKINPNGHIPALQDDGLTLFESMAINLYLAMKHNKGLWPASVEDQARAIQWSFWGMTEVEPHLMKVLFNRVMLPPDRRDEVQAVKALDNLKQPFSVLNSALTGNFLVGTGFSVADLNVAAIMSWTRPSKVDVSAYPSLDQWLATSMDRPAFKVAWGKR
jgi:glutathione S-transferase